MAGIDKTCRKDDLFDGSGRQAAKRGARKMLKELDTRQLRVLRALLEECSVTQAARRLDQSQPNVSLTLRRLREIIGDPILVRSGAKLVPTERGQALLAQVRAVLDGIDQIMGAPTAFDPSVSTAPFRIASAAIERLPNGLPVDAERARDGVPAQAQPSELADLRPEHLMRERLLRVEYGERHRHPGRGSNW